MVGRITLIPLSLCSQRFFGIFDKCKSSVTNMEVRKLVYTRLKKKLCQHLFVVIFSILFLFLIFVLFITNRKQVYKHSEASPFDLHHDHARGHTNFRYGVIIDCGSSGSRVFVYYWPPHTGGKHELLQIQQMVDLDGTPVRKKIKPGISSFADNPQNASSSLRSLLDFASHHVPHAKHHETPLYILATAGMRLVALEKQKAIMKNIINNVPLMSNFYFTESHAEVITGKQEGIYLWIATNYILGRFDHTHDVSTTPASSVSYVVRKQTVGTIEIGGASLQIAYEVPENRSVSPDLSARINLGCDTHQTTHEYQIYVTTFLGYGTDRARRRYVQKIANEHSDKITAHDVVFDPCLPLEMISEEKYKDIKFKVTGSGEFVKCQESLTALLNLTVPCSSTPCSLNGVHQSPVDYDNAEFYGFAEFWYSSNDVWHIGGLYDDEKLEAAANSFCSRKWSLHRLHYAKGLYPKADEYRFKYQCFKAAWMTVVLHKGLKFPKDFKKLTTVQMIKGKEVQWTLGAILYRTRFMPLRDMSIDKVQSSKAQHGYFGNVIVHRGFYAILALCCAIIFIAVYIYYRKMNRYSLPIAYVKTSDLKELNLKDQPLDIRFAV